ncbi:MAG: tRNA (adenosine(37)-N6)-threonylcarbamoyltransferase complex dimerization subunit type 1 TsaB, partial [Acetobacteraceae bacterium]|nr:tRNA (adenosine(37)-N6)-threonylcarbamoyltransferase complex dimerization subunit type 1 TsaB [Acetobacteraceae bacterium]
MPLLALDAALARCSAAIVAEDGTILAEASEAITQGQPARLPALAARVLADAGLPGSGLSAVAAIVGPGSFTGLRTALALAQGIGLAAARPVIGVTTGEALAAAAPAGVTVWATTDNRRGALFLERVGQAPPEVVREEDLPAPAGFTLILGDAAPRATARLAARGHRVALGDA